MKKIAKIAVFLILALAVSVASACGGEESGTPEFAFENDVVWLNRYEETPLVFALGSADGLTFTVADESIVTVGEGGLLIAQGVGETTITVKGKTTEKTITVRVRKTGADPRLTVVDDYAETENTSFAYIGGATELPVRITYGDKLYDVSDWYLTSEDPAVTVDGKTVTGVTEGTAEVTVHAQYKGLTLTADFTVTVLQSSFVTLPDSEIDLYLAESPLKTYTVVPDRVMVDRVDKDVTAIALSVQSGDGVSVEGNVVTATEDAGTAVVRVSAADDADTYADITVRLHPNYIEETLFRVSANLTSSYEAYTGTEPFMAGREGVYKYVADTAVTEADYEAYESASDKMAAATLDDYYSRRLEASTNSDGRFATVADAYRSGYRYFAYDMYYTTRTAARDIPKLDLGTLGQQMDQQISELFTRDDVTVLDEDGNITNRLVTDAWITVVFDMYYRAYNSPTSAFAYYVSLRDKFGELYIDNVRYYLDDAFFAGTGEDKHTPAYKKAVTYGEKDEDGFTAVSNNVFSPYFEMFAEYAPAEGMDSNNDGNPAYLMTATTSIGEWNSAVVLIDSLASSYVQGVQNLRARGSKLVFDIYPLRASGVQFRLNHSLTSKTFNASSDATELDWIDIIDSETGKLARTLTANRWQTVVLHYDRAERPLDGWRANIFIGIPNGGGSLYIDNVRYCDNGDFIPTEVGEAAAVTEAYTGILASTVSYADDGSGDIIYKNNTRGIYPSDGTVFDNWNSGMHFALPDDFRDDNKTWVKFDIQLGEDADILCVNSTGAGGWGDVTPTENYHRSKISLYTRDTGVERLSGYDVGVWYTAFMPVIYDASTESISARIVVGTADEDGFPEARIANIAYFTQSEYETYCEENIHKRAEDLTTRTSELTTYAVYDTYEGEAVIRYVNGKYNTNKDTGSWNTGAYFIGGAGLGLVGGAKENPVTEEDGYKYLKFDLLLDENVNSVFLYDGTNITISPTAKNDKVVIGGTDGTMPTDNEWHTWYVKVSADVTELYIMVRKTEAAGAFPTGYFKDIAYVTDLPAELQPVTEVTTKTATSVVKYDEYGAEKVIRYENRAYGTTDSWNTGISFVTPADFMTDGKKYIRFDFLLESSVTGIKFQSKADNLEQTFVNVTSYTDPNLRGEVAVADASGARVFALQAGVWFTAWLPVVYDEDSRSFSQYFMICGAEETGVPTAYIRNISFETDLPDILQPVTEVTTSPNKAASTTVRYVMDGDDKVIEYVNGTYDYTNGEKWNENVYFIGQGKANPATEENGCKYLKFELKTDENVTSLLINIGGGSNAGLKWIGSTIPAGLYCTAADGTLQTAFPATPAGAAGVWYTWYVPVSPDVTEIYLMLRKAAVDGAWSGGYPTGYLKNIAYVTELPPELQA